MLKAITIWWSHLQSASNKPLIFVYFGRVGNFNWQPFDKRTNSKPCVNQVVKLRANVVYQFWSPMPQRLPILVAKIWLPTLVLYQTVYWVLVSFKKYKNVCTVMVNCLCTHISILLVFISRVATTQKSLPLYPLHYSPFTWSRHDSALQSTKPAWS